MAIDLGIGSSFGNIFSSLMTIVYWIGGILVGGIAAYFLFKGPIFTKAGYKFRVFVLKRTTAGLALVEDKARYVADDAGKKFFELRKEKTKFPAPSYSTFVGTDTLFIFKISKGIGVPIHWKILEDLETIDAEIKVDDVEASMDLYGNEVRKINEMTATKQSVLLQYLPLIVILVTGVIIIILISQFVDKISVAQNIAGTLDSAASSLDHLWQISYNTTGHIPIPAPTALP